MGNQPQIVTHRPSSRNGACQAASAYAIVKPSSSNGASGRRRRSAARTSESSVIPQNGNPGRERSYRSGGGQGVRGYGRHRNPASGRTRHDQELPQRTTFRGQGSRCHHWSGVRPNRPDRRGARVLRGRRTSRVDAPADERRPPFCPAINGSRDGRTTSSSAQAASRSPAFGRLDEPVPTAALTA